MKKVCIVGFGAIGPMHADAILKTKNAELYAICDTNADVLAAASEKYAVKTYGDFDATLSDPEIDSVHICTPHYLHFEMIKKALAAKKAVVCEKPAVMTPSEFDELLHLPDSDKVCFVLQNRLNPCVLKLRDIAKGGCYGKIIAAKGILTWSRSKEYYAHDAWRGKWDTEGGGVLINQAVHTMDFFSFVSGGVHKLSAQMTNFSLPEIEVEDTFCARLKLRGGGVGIFFATNGYGVNSAPQFEIVFEKGVIKYSDGKLFADGAVIKEDTVSVGGKAYWGSGHERLIAEYYDNNKYFGAADIKNTMDTLFAMYESARCGGKEITL